MRQANSQQAARYSTSSNHGRTSRTATICIVDPRRNDYANWDAVAEVGGARVQYVANAEEALRFARESNVDLWVVNTALAGLSGYELCSMLKSRSPRIAVYLIADQYSVEAEQAAWAARATLFGCKPGHASWLADWLSSRTGHREPLQTLSTQAAGTSFSAACAG